MKKVYIVKDSKIHGKGVFANKAVNKNEIIGLGIRFHWGIMPIITPNLGSLINHCGKPNTKLVWHYSDSTKLKRFLKKKKSTEEPQMGWYLVTAKPVKKGDEFVLDYADTPFYIQGPLAHYKC